jgi:hypothetical protein
MTWASAYLIKSAVTVGRLAATAKAQGIPLIGDWRYAAKLLGRQATPAGKAHYEHVVGFPTETEKSIIKSQMRKARSLKSSQELYEQEVNKLTGAGMNPAMAGMMMMMPWAERAGSDPWRTVRQGLEGGIYKKPGMPYELAVPGPGMLAVPVPALSGTVDEANAALMSGKGIPLPYSRVVHTHPSFERMRGSMAKALAYVPEYRRGAFGNVMPSSNVLTESLPSRELTARGEAQARTLAQIQAGRLPEKKKQKAILRAVTEHLNWLDSPEGRAAINNPRRITSLDEHIAAIKETLAKGQLPVGDVSFLNAPHATHAIWAPSSGTESVFKGGGGQLKRLYFRQVPN